MTRARALELRTEGQIAELTLAPEASLAHLAADLHAVAETLDDTACEVRCVLLTAQTPDWRVTGAAADAAFATDFTLIETLRQPVIAVIEGRCAGPALELALACDLRIAGPAARFAMPQVVEGSLPSLGGTQRLPRIAGRAKALEMLLLGDDVDTSAALRSGLVNHVAATEPPREAALRIARAIAARGPVAVAYAKEAVLRGLDLPLEQALRYETDLTVILQTTEDRDEGVRAFLEKRPPRFRGR